MSACSQQSRGWVPWNQGKFGSLWLWASGSFLFIASLGSLPSSFGEGLKISSSVCRGAILQCLLGCPLPSHASIPLFQKLACIFFSHSADRPSSPLGKCSSKTSSLPRSHENISQEDPSSSTLRAHKALTQGQRA